MSPARHVVAALACVAVLAAPLPAQQGLANWLNARIDSLVAARIAQRDGAKTPDIPALSASDAALVDRAALPDIVGISLTLPGQPASRTGPQPSATSISGTLYSLWALLKGSNALDQSFYLRSPFARRFAVSATFDTDSLGKTTGLVQAKIVILDRGNAVAAAAGALAGPLAHATAAYGRLVDSVQMILFRRVGEPRRRQLLPFINLLSDSAGFAQVLSLAGPPAVDAVDAAIAQELGSFEELRDGVSAAVEAARARPQLAIGVTAHTSASVASQARAVLILDYRARQSLDLTFNAGLEHLRAIGPLPQHTRVAVAGQLLLRLTPDRGMSGRGPVSFTLAGSGAFDTKSGNQNVFKIQARLTLPLAEGVSVPVSTTWASRTDLINEDHVRGLVGFSFDLGQVLGAK
jgi:hypothetical protein